LIATAKQEAEPKNQLQADLLKLGKDLQTIAYRMGVQAPEMDEAAREALKPVLRGLLRGLACGNIPIPEPLSQ